MSRTALAFWVIATLRPDGWAAAQEQSTSTQAELISLQERIARQQQQLRAQREAIETIRAEISEQEQLLKTWMASRQTSLAAPARPGSPPAAAAKSKLAAPKPTGIRIPVAAGQEIPTAGDTSPAFKLGPADVRVQGYLGVSGIFRTASMGGGPGTNFASVPLDNTIPANLTELRMTTQTSRMALRIDTPFQKDRVSGYVEADFSGATPGNALISSSSYGFRVRHAFINYRHANLEVAAGQMFSLLTPTRGDIQPWPGDAATTSAIDTNYVAGLVWDRAPALRLVYRPTKRWSLGVSIENPEQQVGVSVRFPAALNDVLSSQYNTGRGELRTPNLAPDTIVKAAWNGTVGKRNLHIDMGTVFRFFRSVDATDIRSHQHALGIGGNVNFILDLTRRIRLVGQMFVSSGGGRYIGASAPDVIVRSDGEISPVKAHSWVSGLEWSATRRISIYGYYSGLYAARNTALDLNGSPIGFGFTGSTNARRVVQEWTTGWSQGLWSGEDAGSVQYGVQYSWLRNTLWSFVNPPGAGSVHMVFSQIRYNLP